MKLEQLIREVGGNVFQKEAQVECIGPIGGGQNILAQVRILDPSTVPVNRVDTWLVKTDDQGEVTCVLMPHRFPIMLTVEFALRGAMVFPEVKEAYLIDTILNNIAVGDKLHVLHILPAMNPGKYCQYQEPALQEATEG